MATWREALDNVRAGNVALKNNVRFNVAGFYYVANTWANSPSIIIEVDTTGTPNEKYIEFKDGAKFGIEYLGSDSSFHNIKYFAYIPNQPITYTTAGGIDCTWRTDNATPLSFQKTISGGTIIDVNIKKVALGFGMMLNNDGQPDMTNYYVLAVLYPTLASNDVYGYMWQVNYGEALPYHTRGQWGDDSVRDYLAGDTSEPTKFPGDASGGGGGSGWFISQNDVIDIPALPSIQVIDFGFSKIYNPSVAQMQSIAQWLWSDDFDENIKLNFVSPFENIVTIALVPWGLTTVAGIMRIGNVDSNIPVPIVTRQYDEVNCGSINVLEYWGSFLDYNATYSIYLPYIGFRSLKPDDFVNGDLGVVYHIDILTGCVVAFIWAIKEDGIKHVLYTYSGNMFYNVAFSGANYMSMYNQQLSATTSGINNAVQSIGKALGGDILGGVTSLLTGQAQAKREYETAKPDYGRGGNGSGNAGIFGIRYPYLVQCLPIGQPPKDYTKLQGIPAQINCKLSTLTGYTEVETANVSQLTNCTDSEKDEILTLLKGGVYL